MSYARKYARAQGRSSGLKSLTSIFGSAPWRNKASTHGLSSFIMAICKGVIPEKRNKLEIKLCPIIVGPALSTYMHTCSQDKLMNFKKVFILIFGAKSN